MFLNILLILAGFGVLIFSANVLVNGSSGLAKRFNLSDLLIGLTVVAFGTSAPELVVNLKAVINPDTTDIALSNIIGSNMINTFVILGIAAIIFPITSRKSSRIFDIPLSFLGPVAVLLMALDGRLSLLDGIILLILFLSFLVINVNKAKKHPDEIEDPEHYEPMKIWKAVLLILVGIAGLIGGAELIVPNATQVAASLGVSQAAIGLTIVALGTSLPELATSAVSAYKKNSDIALGNVLGSNIFNIFFILGTSAVFRDLPNYIGMYFDLGATALASLMLILLLRSNQERMLQRWAGGLMLGTYLVYLVWTLNNI